MNKPMVALLAIMCLLSWLAVWAMHTAVYADAQPVGHDLRVSYANANANARP